MLVVFCCVWENMKKACLEYSPVQLQLWFWLILSSLMGLGGLYLSMAGSAKGPGMAELGQLVCFQTRPK